MWIAKNNDLIVSAKKTRKELKKDLKLKNFTSIEETNVNYQLYDGRYLTPEEIAVLERQRLDKLMLTPADVERALYQAKHMDFDDLKVFIAQQLPQVDIKALGIEFRARDFYRGATAKSANNMRLFDVIGQLLGYTSADMDYLFEHKELPEK